MGIRRPACRQALLTGDLDGDGRTDLFDMYDTYYKYYPNQGAGTTFNTVTGVWMYQLGGGFLHAGNRAALADFNGDNCDDLVFSSVTSGWFQVYHNNCTSVPAQRGFSLGISNGGLGTNHPAIKQVFGDFNADGLADYADVNLDTGEIWWHANLGPGLSFNQVHGAYGTYSSTPGFSILGFGIFFY